MKVSFHLDHQTTRCSPARVRYARESPPPRSSPGGGEHKWTCVGAARAVELFEVVLFNLLPLGVSAKQFGGDEAEDGGLMLRPSAQKLNKILIRKEIKVLREDVGGAGGWRTQG